MILTFGFSGVSAGRFWFSGGLERGGGQHDATPSFNYILDTVKGVFLNHQSKILPYAGEVPEGRRGLH